MTPSSNAYDVIVLRKDDLKDCFDYVAKTYKTKLFYELYDNYKPKYKYICSCCKKEFETESKRNTEIKFCSRFCSGKYRQANKNNVPID